MMKFLQNNCAFVNSRLLSIAIVLLGIIPSIQAQIVLNVSGGTGNTPLTINITTGADFVATGANSANGNAGIIFDNFWNNTTDTFSSSASTQTVSLASSSQPTSSGGFDAGDAQVSDLFIGFTDVPAISVSDNVTLSTGTRVTGNLNLNHTTINASGNAFLANSTATIISGALTWTTVPEPSTYAAIFGCLLVGLAIWRRTHHSRHRVGV